MTTDNLKLWPHKIRGTKSAWWYEEDQGVYVIVEPTNESKTLLITWAALRYALRRKDAT